MNTHVHYGGTKKTLGRAPPSRVTMGRLVMKVPAIPKAGDTVERYELLEILGSGGMGSVFAALDTRLQRKVAIKTLHPSSLAVPEAASRMLREARAAAALTHPNVVAVYDVGQVAEPSAFAGTMYLAMELVRGEPLRAFVGRQDVPIEERVRWLADIARALQAAHTGGLVHRDVKPENVMLREDGVIKVLDFGVAKRAYDPKEQPSSSDDGFARTITRQGIAVGTPFYMSPEQMRCERLDGRSDQFSWAVVAYELLTGEPPWTLTADPLQLVAEVLSKREKPASEVNPQIPRWISDIVSRALQKAPSDRFANMADILAQLERGPSSLVRVVDEADGDSPTAPHIETPRAPPVQHATGPGVVAGVTVPPPSENAAPTKTRGGWGMRMAAAGALLAFGSVTVVAARGFSAAPAQAGAGLPEVATRSHAAELPAEPTSSKVPLRVTVQPANSTIEIDQQAPVASPFVGIVTADGLEHQLTIRAPGHTTQSRSIRFDGPHTLELTLAPAHLAPVGPTQDEQSFAARRKVVTKSNGPTAAAAPEPPAPAVSTRPNAGAKHPIDTADPYR